ncbi:alpha/beta hydrolase [Spirillospora sp. NPDC049024]
MTPPFPGRAGITRRHRKEIIMYGILGRSPERPRSRRTPWSAVALALAASALAACTASAATVRTGAADDAGHRPPVPTLRWDERCAQGGGAYVCDTARVPLDYDHPDGPQIDLRVIKRPAADRRHRIGTLFFNSGGPGNALTSYLPALYDRFPQQVKERFDVVGFDPRGVGESTAVQCFPTAADEQELFSRLPAGFPIGQAEESRTLAVFARFAKACATRDPALLSHVSTANTARDMDLLRRAVGDPKLSYYGLSYGTLIGATYANLFPGRVRAMVLDSVLEPVAYTKGRHGEARRLGTALRLREDVDRMRTLNAFLDLCGRAGSVRCPFSTGTAEGTRAKYSALLEALRRRPVQVGDETYTYASTVAAVSWTLEATTAIPGAVDAGWPQGAELLQTLWQAAHGTAPRAPHHTRVQDTGDRYDGPEQFAAIACSESPNPRDPSSYPAQAAWAEGRSGDAGRMSAWKLAVCADWAFTDRDRYAGPWNRHTSAPVLVIGVTHDPQTPYANSVALTRELSRARLLTVEGYGHGAIQNRSTCADDHQAAYLVTGKLPALGTTCAQDEPPFTAPSP